MSDLAQLLARRAGEAGDAPLLESARDDRVVTRADAAAATAAWADRLAGLPEGARVGLRGRDPLLLALGWLGIVASGRCVAPIGPDADQAARASWQATVEPWSVVDADTYALDGSGPGLSVRDGSTGVGGVLLTSSGTTGRPKLVALTEDQLLATAENVVAAHKLTAADRCLNPLPLWHINAEVVALLGTVVGGGAVVFDERFRRTGFWKLVADSRATWINGVPAMLAILAQEDPEPPVSKGVRFVRSASAPLLPSVQRQFEERTGIGVVQTYGMTEAASQITAEALPEEGRSDHELGTVGRPVGLELRVVDDANEELPATVVGRVQIRGRAVITAYASAAGQDRVTADGWLDTGDLGQLTEAGNLLLDGRADDVINRGGEKFSPLHVEDVLLAVPGIEVLAVVGAPDAVLGQVPVAAVVGTRGADERLAAYAEAHLDKVRRPVRFHQVEELPGGVNGKISRRAVLARLRDLGLES